MKNPKSEIPAAPKPGEGGQSPNRTGLKWAIAVSMGAAWLAFCTGAAAQPYTVDWYKIAGGGGTCTGGVYVLSGTIGQHDAGGPMTGQNYSLTGGFWALISTVQTPGAPFLNISHVGNTVTVYWQALPGWTLQQNQSLTAPAGWTASSGVTTSNGTNYLTISPPTGNGFFRLKSQ
jgi:hypothetical protein